MPNLDNSTELALQICFGVFGVFSTLATLAGLHHHDSLGCVLIRRLRGRRITHDHDLVVDAANTRIEDLGANIDDSIRFERSPTLPPSYKQTSDGSHLEAFHGSGIDDGPANTKSDVP